MARFLLPLPRPSRKKSSKIPIVEILRKLPRSESVQVTRSQQIAGLRAVIIVAERFHSFALTQPYHESHLVIFQIVTVVTFNPLIIR